MTTDDERFKQIKMLLGRLDDLNQDRRRLFTDWGTRRIEGTEFVTRMRANLSQTREAAGQLEELLS